MCYRANFITKNFLHRLILWLYITYFFINIVFISCAYAETDSEQAPAIGNFSLPSSQQPGAFLSFGQNTLEKGKTQLYLFADDFAGHQQQHYIDAAPGIVYGISDNLSVFFNVPYAVSYQQASNHSSGLEDIVLQLEYVFYSKQTKRYSDTATWVANTNFPSGSSAKNPPTGFGAQSYFMGGTFSRLYTDWLVFFSPGVLAPTVKNNTKFGNRYYYQFGLGKNISYVTSKYIFGWLLELDGTFAQKNIHGGNIDPNSGGNLIYATPSLWFSTQHFILQVGMGWAVVQHLYGNQPKYTYLIAANLGWTF